MSKYNIYIDNRETKLIDLLKEVDIPKFNKSVKALKVGDIVITKEFDQNCDETDNSFDDNLYKNTILIFERKTCSDLLSSINDGRYREQKSRLLANFNRKQICYIIENDIDYSLNKYRKNGRQIVIGALVNKCFRDNIKTIKTRNLNETVEFLLNICKKVISNPEFFAINDSAINTNENSISKENTQIENSLENTQIVDNENTGNTENIQIGESYTSNIKIAKKDNINPTTFSVLSLSIIPGVSHKISEIIIEYFGSLTNLILKAKKDFEENNTYENTILEISNIQMELVGGKKRKIGKVVSSRIITMLFQ